MLGALPVRTSYGCLVSNRIPTLRFFCLRAPNGTEQPMQANDQALTIDCSQTARCSWLHSLCFDSHRSYILEDTSSAGPTPSGSGSSTSLARRNACTFSGPPRTSSRCASTQAHDIAYYRSCAVLRQKRSWLSVQQFFLLFVARLTGSEGPFAHVRR